MNTTICTILLFLKVALYVVLVFYINKVRRCIDNIDSLNIKHNFKIVEYVTYALVTLTYISFVYKDIISPNDTEKNVYKGLTYINMSLVLVLLTFVFQTKNALTIAENGSVPISFLDNNFRTTEYLAYIIAGFFILTKILILGSKNTNIKEKVMMSLQSLYKRRKRSSY